MTAPSLLTPTGHGCQHCETGEWANGPERSRKGYTVASPMGTVRLCRQCVRRWYPDVADADFDRWLLQQQAKAAGLKLWR